MQRNGGFMSTNKEAAQQILSELQPVLDKLKLSALVLYDEDDSVAEEDNPLLPPKRRPKNKKVSKTKRKKK